jgi:enamine deaminase RidA (YjgF/YER057c/UK114 family)
MGAIERISTNAPWEPIAGYSRAVKAGDWVMVSGTTATGAQGGLVGAGQMYVQAKQAIANLAAALGRLGLDLRHVVRTRIFVTDILRFDSVARAHREAFGQAPPASTMVEVRRLVHPDMLVEIEADAYAGAVEAAAPPAHIAVPEVAPKPLAAPPRPEPPKPQRVEVSKAAAPPPPVRSAEKPRPRKAAAKPKAKAKASAAPRAAKKTSARKPPRRR